jgi:hypothetical protein
LELEDYKDELEYEDEFRRADRQKSLYAPKRETSVLVFSILIAIASIHPFPTIDKSTSRSEIVLVLELVLVPEFLLPNGHRAKPGSA